MNSLFDESAVQFDEENLLLKNLKTLSTATLRRGLRRWLKQMRGDLRGLETKHFDAIEKLILSQKSGKIAELPNGERIIKESGELIFMRENVENKE